MRILGGAASERQLFGRPRTIRRMIYRARDGNRAVGPYRRFRGLGEIACDDAQLRILARSVDKISPTSRSAASPRGSLACTRTEDMGEAPLICCRSRLPGLVQRGDREVHRKRRRISRPLRLLSFVGPARQKGVRSPTPEPSCSCRLTPILTFRVHIPLHAGSGRREELTHIHRRSPSICAWMCSSHVRHHQSPMPSGAAIHISHP